MTMDPTSASGVGLDLPEADPAPDMRSSIAADRPDLRWPILILLSLGVMISFVDCTSIASALALPAFKRQFGLSDLDRGWVSSAFF